MSAPDAAAADAARRDHLRGVLRGLVADLQAYAEQARATGADALPAASPEALRAAYRSIQVAAPTTASGAASGAAPGVVTGVVTGASRGSRPLPSRRPARPPGARPGAPGSGPGARRTRPQGPAPAKVAPPHAVPGEGLADIRADLGACARCPLSQTRRNLVYGVGPADARVVLVGEAPGRDEDATGEPFVGRAGRVLNRMLESIGLSRREVYITNVLKCRPPNNRDPTPSEVATCSPFLHRQLRAIAPRAILTLGRFAAANITGLEGSMGALRRQVHEVTGVPVVSTYHPAYFLRNPEEKAKGWEDLLRLRALLRSAGPP